ncbi:hypothetical protein BS78_04G002900 [Paspalum vaginatum]|nr:hypothetical protein BS78_04G002900 [Paspalum vaginatum]
MSPPHQTESCGLSSSEPVPVPAVVTVDVTAARELLISGQNRYLEVRTEEELAKLGYVVEMDRSLNVPYMFITPQGTRVKNAEFVEQVASRLMSSSKQEHVIVGCQSGKRSELACIDLQAAGFTNVKNMGGGYLAWLQHGFPVHHPMRVPGDMATTSPPAGTQA